MDREDRELFRRVRQDRSQEVANADAREEVGIESVASHHGFVEHLVVPPDMAGALAQSVGMAG